MDDADSVQHAGAVKYNCGQWVVDDRQVDVLDFKLGGSRRGLEVFDLDGSLLKDEQGNGLVGLGWRDRRQKAGQVQDAVGITNDMKTGLVQFHLANGDYAVAQSFLVNLDCCRRNG